MGFKFEMSPNWERDVERTAQGAIEDIAADYQKMFDRLTRQYKGRPASAIKPVLRREWSRCGGTISDPELTDYAQRISEGQRFQFKAGK